MPQSGTMYNYAYNHARKEIIIMVHIGTNKPIEIVMSVEGFFSDIEFVKKDKKLAHWLSEVKKMKDLPVDYDFGPRGAAIKFDEEDWNKKMGEDKP